MVKKLFRDLLARSFGPEAGGVIGGKEILHVPRRLHERVERSRAFAREDDRARQHPIWQRTASTAKTTPTVGGGKKKEESPGVYSNANIYSTQRKQTCKANNILTVSAPTTVFHQNIGTGLPFLRTPLHTAGTTVEYVFSSVLRPWRTRSISFERNKILGATMMQKMAHKTHT